MQENDYELIIKFKEGDQLSFEELVNRYEKKVFATTCRYFRDNDDAKDAYQEIFIRVFKGLKKFEFRSSFSTWLYRIAVNVCLTMKSGNAMSNHTVSYNYEAEGSEEKSHLDSLTDGVTPNDDSQRKEIGEKVQSALSALSPKQKMVFVLKHYEGYKIREIAQMLETKEGTVKKYLFEAIQRLRLQLSGYEL